MKNYDHKNLRFEVVVGASCQVVDDGEESVDEGKCHWLEGMRKPPRPAIFVFNSDY